MWPTWWWPQALMQPEILILRSPISCWRAEVGEVLGDALRHRDRAGVGQRAVVEARAGDDVGDQADVGLGEAQPPERRVDRRQVLDRDMRQDEVLLVADPHLALAVASARSATPSICSELASPGGAPAGFSETVTMA